MMKLLYQGYFEYPNNWNNLPAFCFLELWGCDERKYVALITDLPEDKGLSVANAIERIITLICHTLHVAPDDLTVVEHDRGPDSSDTYHLVTFDSFDEPRLCGQSNHLWTERVGNVRWSPIEPNDERLTQLPGRRDWSIG